MTATAFMNAQALSKEGKWKVRLSEVGEVDVKCHRPRGEMSLPRRFASRCGGNGESGGEAVAEGRFDGEEEELSRPLGSIVVDEMGLRRCREVRNWSIAVARREEL